MKPNCHDCIHRRDIPGDAHSECAHPLITPTDKILAPFMMMAGKQDLGIMKRLNVRGDETGVKHGWFLWPLNFDPTWLLTCEGFEKKWGESNETIENQ